MVDTVGRQTNFAVLVIYEEIVNDFDFENTMVDKVGRKTNFAVLVIYEEIVNDFDVFCWSHCKKNAKMKSNYISYAQKSRAV